MKENLYKRLPPLERRPDGSLYHMTPAQRKQANSLIRRECCNCEDGNCLALDDGVVVKHFCNTLFENSPGISSFKWCFPIIVGMRTDMIVPYVHISV